MNKASLRAFYRERRTAFQKQTDSFEQASQALSQNIQKFVSGLPHGSLVLAYQAMPSEPKIPWLKGLRMAFPRIREGSGFEMDFYEVKDPKKGLIKNRMGILEPDPSQSGAVALVEGKEAQVVFVPGVSFDGRGFRLGLGKGYYDRFLASLPGEVLKIGVCFKAQLHDESLTGAEGLKIDPWDLPVDGLITEQNWIGYLRRKKK